MDRQKTEKMLELLQDQVLSRKAMFIPLFCISAFGLVGYAAADRQAPVIKSDKIRVLYGTELTAKNFDITDNRQDASSLDVKIDKSTFNKNQLGTYNVKVTAKDAFNNESEKTVEVSVVDTAAPVISAKNSEGYAVNVNLNGSSDIKTYIKAVDNVDGDVSEFMETDRTLDTSKKGVQAIVVTASDEAGNKSSKKFYFNVSDIAAPKITLKSGNKVTVNYGSSFDINDYVKVSDNTDHFTLNVDGDVNTKKEDEYKLNITATDNSGNKSQETLTVEVKDIEAPQLKLSASETKVFKGRSFDAYSYIKSSYDNKDGNLVSKVEPKGSVNTNKLGYYTIKYTVEDSAGNKSDKSLKVKVYQKETSSSSTRTEKVRKSKNGQTYTETQRITTTVTTDELGRTRTSTSTKVISSTYRESSYSSGGNSGLASTAYGRVGSRYVHGGSGPSKFDCSGLAQYVYRKNGKSIPRTAAAQYASSHKVSYSSLRAGDLVFFRGTTGRGGITHVAIYVGNGKIVHAGTESTGVTVSKLSSSYYQKHYAGAGRY